MLCEIRHNLRRGAESTIRCAHAHMVIARREVRGDFRVDLPLLVAKIDNHLDVEIAVVKSYEHAAAIERALLGAHEASEPL